MTEKLIHSHDVLIQQFALNVFVLILITINIVACCSLAVFDLLFTYFAVMELSPTKGTGVEGEIAAAPALGNSEILYQNLIGDICQSANTCKVMEVMGLANNGITSPEPSLLFGCMMGFPNTPISWEELYYGQLQFDLPTDLLTINIKDGCFEQHLQPTAVDGESLYVRLNKSVQVLVLW